MSCASTSYKLIAKFKLVYLPPNWRRYVVEANEVIENDICGISWIDFKITDYGLRYEGVVGNACLDDVVSALRRLGELLGTEPRIHVKCL